MNSYPNHNTNKHEYSTTKNENVEIELLRDVASNGKERDWSGKKERSLLTAEHYEAADLIAKAEKVYECGNYLVFKMKDGKMKLYKAYFCKVRLCPMCNWRRSLKVAAQNKAIVERANETENVTWLFLTLTLRNVEGHELKSTVDDMMKAWDRFSRYAKFKKSVKGYFRALEITKNRDWYSKSYGTYHPHFHVLLCVPKSYFKKKELYIKHEDWIAMWQKALKIDYKPVVRIQKVKPKEQAKDVQEIESELSQAIQEMEEVNAVFEVSKYPVKDTDVIRGDKLTKDNVETLIAFDTAIARKRLIAYGGLLKQIHHELNLDDAEDGDLIHVGDDDDDEVANGVFDVIAYWHFGLKNYVIKN